MRKACIESLYPVVLLFISLAEICNELQCDPRPLYTKMGPESVSNDDEEEELFFSLPSAAWGVSQMPVFGFETAPQKNITLGPFQSMI